VILTLAIPAKAQDQTIVDKGDPAPAHGVFVPSETYIKMQTDIHQRDDLEKALRSCEDKGIPTKTIDGTTLMGIGFLAGILSAVVIARSIH
jgi:hypothetical protein